jgi:hypothetical protein
MIPRREEETQLCAVARANRRPMFKLVGAFDVDKLQEESAILKRTREQKPEVDFDNNPELRMNSKTFLRCAMSLILRIINATIFKNSESRMF